MAILRQKHSEVAARYGATDRADIRACSVVVAELRYGCEKSAKPGPNRAIVDALLAPVMSLSFDDAAADHFVSIRRRLESLGQAISLSGVLSGFDRIRFRGTQRLLASAGGLAAFLGMQKIRLNHFATYISAVTDRFRTGS